MRVYGSSPLYNYVELVFRSKRLFIASILIATVVTVAVANARTGSYSAQALVYLTGSDTATPTVTDSAQKGSIQYKLNLLNVTTKDPEFIKSAFKENGLNRGMTDEQFDKFCKDARNALTFASGNNVLEINCHWPDARAADIINAFFGAFSRRVLDEESATSHIATEAIISQLAEYTAKQRGIEQKVIAFKQAHTETMPSSFETDVQNLAALKERVAAIQNQLNQGQLTRDEVQRQLANTPQTIVDQSVSKTNTALLDQLQTQMAQLDTDLSKLRAIYTDSNPQIKKLLQQKELLSGEIKDAEQKLGVANGKAKPTQVREVPNPNYQRLQQTLSDYEISLQALQGNLKDAQTALATMQHKIINDPKVLQQYDWMTKDYRLYTEIRDNLRARLEQARINENQDRQMHLAEMRMIVPPQSELEIAGAKNMLFFAAGPLLGLIIAFAFSLLTESLDHSLRTPIEVEKYLGKPVLAVLPRMETPKDSTQRRLAGGGDARPTLPG